MPLREKTKGAFAMANAPGKRRCEDYIFDYFFAWAKFSATWDQLTTFQKASM